MPRTATNLPKDEQAIYDRAALNKKRIANLLEKGDKTSDKEKAELATLQTAVKDDGATLKRMGYKRNLGASVEAFITAARRLRGRAGGHTEAQAGYVRKLVADHAESIDAAFAVIGQAPAKESSVQIPD